MDNGNDNSKEQSNYVRQDNGNDNSNDNSKDPDLTITTGGRVATQASIQAMSEEEDPFNSGVSGNTGITTKSGAPQPDLNQQATMVCFTIKNCVIFFLFFLFF